MDNQSYLGEGDLRPEFLAAANSRRPKFLKSFAFLVLIALLAFAAFIIFGSNSLLGPHLESLFTEATSTDYAAYTMRSNEIMLEILEGKQELPDYFADRLQQNNFTVANGAISYNGETVTADNFMTFYNGNVDFREDLNNARHDRAALFFDSAAEEFFNKLGFSRDVFHDYETTGDNAVDEASYNEKMTAYFDVDGGATINTVEEIYVEDEDGNVSVEYVSSGENATTASTSGENAEDRAREYLDSVGEKVTAKSAGNATKQVGELVATAVSANDNYTAAHKYMTRMENLSKSKYGEGDTSAASAVLNWFTKTDTATVYDAKTGEKVEATGSPLEAEGMRVVLGGLAANKSNTQKYSLERSFDSTIASIFNSGFSVEDDEKTTQPSISLSAQAVPGSSLIRATIGSLLNFSEEGIKITASSVLSLMVPTVAQVFFSNPYENDVGIAGGENFAMGAANINQLSAQHNSGASAASKEQVLAYNQAYNAVLAQSAEIDRKNHSPFDASNSNTFLGSIVSSLLPLATTTSTASVPLTTLASTVQTSLASLNSVSAAGENSSFMTSFGDCEKLAGIGAAGNLYCKSTATHDLSVIGLSEDDETYRAVLSESLEYVDGKEIIIENSPLADFINFWTERYSAPGVHDANIAYECMHRHGYVPLLSNIADLITPTSEYCESVADGSRYVASADNPAWGIEKYHQLYVLTNRVKTNLGFYADGESPVAVYKSNYEAAHPLDNSRAGYLARISGLTKNDAETVLALADYYQKLDDYNPATAFNFVSGDAREVTLMKGTPKISNQEIFGKDNERHDPERKRREVSIS